MTYFPPQVLRVFKTADEEKQTVDEVLEEDSELSLDLPTGDWIVSARLYMNISEAGGVRLGMTGANVTIPSSFHIEPVFSVPPGTFGDDAFKYIRDFNSQFYKVAASGAVSTYFPFSFVLRGDLVVASASASVAISWCEDLETYPAKMLKHSWLQAERL
jgi:hypothetical protein